MCDLWCQLITLNFKLPLVYIWPGTTLGVSQGWLHFNRRSAVWTRAFPRARAATSPVLQHSTTIIICVESYQGGIARALWYFRAVK